MEPKRTKTSQRKSPNRGTSHQSDKGWANEDTPQWHPPESVPEPRPAEPILDTHSSSTPKS